jgi:hypothetical protein
VNHAFIETQEDFGDNESCFGPGWDRDIMRFARPIVVNNQNIWLTPSADINDSQIDPNYIDVTFSFGSSHLLSMNAANADGAVRQIDYDINPRVFRAMSIRNDGQIVAE